MFKLTIFLLFIFTNSYSAENELNASKRPSDENLSDQASKKLKTEDNQNNNVNKNYDYFILRFIGEDDSHTKELNEKVKIFLNIPDTSLNYEISVNVFTPNQLKDIYEYCEYQKNEKIFFGQNIKIFKRDLEHFRCLIRLIPENERGCSDLVTEDINSGKIYEFKFVKNWQHRHPYTIAYNLNIYDFQETYNKTLKALTANSPFNLIDLDQLVASYVEDKDKPWL